MPRKGRYADVKLRSKLAWQLKLILALTLVAGLGVLGSVLGRADVTAREAASPPLQTPTATPRPPDPVVKVEPTTALPNDAIIITGTGFTTGSGITIAKITIGSETMTLPDKKVDEGAAVKVDSAGNFGATVIIPIKTTTLTTGSQTVSAVDSSGRTGRTTLTFPNRVLKVDPETSRRDSTVTVTGTGFPVSSTRPGAEPNPSVRITYEITGGATKTVATTSTNSSGGFTASFFVPLDALIPSRNTVRAEIVGTTPSVSETKPHSIPDRSMTISPNSGPAGAAITVTGSNFPAFAVVSSLTIGRIQVLPSPAPLTNAEGSFTTGIVVPPLEVGTQPVAVAVGDSTFLISFRVTAPPATPVPTATPVPPKPTGPAAQLAPLGANLVRVWGFNAATQKFQLYDPAAPPLSDLTTLVQGRGYWILVTRDQTVTLSSGSYSLSVGWNLIGWLG